MKRNQSALVPILQGPFEGKRVCVYNSEVREKNPLTALLAAARPNLVSIERIVPIHSSPCALCQINQGRGFYQINHLMNVTARRPTI